MIRLVALSSRSIHPDNNHKNTQVTFSYVLSIIKWQNCVKIVKTKKNRNSIRKHESSKTYIVKVC